MDEQSLVETSQLFLAKILVGNEFLFLILAPSGLLLTAAAVFYLVISRRRVKETKEIENLESAEDRSSKQEAPEADRAKIVKVHAGLEKTRNSWRETISKIFSAPTVLDDQIIERIHEVLYRADVGVNMTKKLIERVKVELRGKEVSWDQVKACLKDEISNELQRCQGDGGFGSGPFSPTVGEGGLKPFVLMIVGVNGAGKTTTIAKLTHRLLGQEKTVILAAADTYRAAAIDQLKVWGERLKVDVIAQVQGADPAAVAFDACKAANARDMDVLLVDTAGRLHNKKELMDELAKVKRVMAKEIPAAPHDVWLILDATTGQNGLQQVKAFCECVEVTGLIVTKLDGTAKGGIVIAAASETRVPVRFIGLGEKAEDLEVFNPVEFVDGLFDMA